MKLLVDTCVWSLSLRRRGNPVFSSEEQQLLTLLSRAIQDFRTAIIGPVREEILSGIRDRGHFAKTQGLLDPFPDEELISADYVQAARLFNVCRDHGVECGATDILICAVAARKGWAILTSDGGLKRCIELLQTEGLLNSAPI